MVQPHALQAAQHLVDAAHDRGKAGPRDLALGCCRWLTNHPYFEALGQTFFIFFKRFGL